MTLDDLKAYTELKKHIREHMDDYDMDNVERARFVLWIHKADKEIDLLLDRYTLVADQRKTLLRAFLSLPLPESVIETYPDVTNIS